MNIAGGEFSRGARKTIRHGDHQRFLQTKYIGEIAMVLQRIHHRQFGCAWIAEQMGDPLVFE